MDEIRPEIAEVDKQKDRERYNLLDNQKTFILGLVDNMRRGLRALMKSDREELDKLKEAPNPDKQEIELREARQEQMAAELSSLDEFYTKLKEGPAKP